MNPDLPGPNIAKSRTSKLLILVLVVFVLIIAGELIYQVLRSKTFLINGTNPATSNVTTVTPFFDINFTSNVSGQGIAVTSSPKIINSYSVSGKSLDISLVTPLNAGEKYTITLLNASGDDGKTISNKVFTFVPKYVESQKIPQDQQKALLQQQSTPPPSVTNINFINFNDLLNYGVTTQQVNNLEQAFFQYTPSAKVITINASSINPAPHDPTSTSTTFGINFGVSIDSTSYNATLDYSNFTTIQLYLYNPSSGATLYNSNEIGT